MPDHGRIARLVPEKDCGFIAMVDGQELLVQVSFGTVVDFDGPKGWDHSATALGRVGDEELAGVADRNVHPMGTGAARPGA